MCQPLVFIPTQSVDAATGGPGSNGDCRHGPVDFQSAGGLYTAGWKCVGGISMIRTVVSIYYVCVCVCVCVCVHRRT